jgi:hypothetical protein
VFERLTATTPAELAADTQVAKDPETQVLEVQEVDPSLTLSPLLKFVPVMVTVVPPAKVPPIGEIEDMVGFGSDSVVALLSRVLSSS